MDNNKEILEQLYHLNNLIINNIKNNSETKENNSENNKYNSEVNIENPELNNNNSELNNEYEESVTYPLQQQIINTMNRLDEKKISTSIQEYITSGKYIAGAQTPVIIFDTFIPSSTELWSLMLSKLTYNEYKVMTMLLNIYKMDDAIKCTSYPHAYFFCQDFVKDKVGLEYNDYLKARNNLTRAGILKCTKTYNNRNVFTFDFVALYNFNANYVSNDSNTENETEAETEPDTIVTDSGIKIKLSKLETLVKIVGAHMLNGNTYKLLSLILPSNLRGEERIFTEKDIWRNISLYGNCYYRAKNELLDLEYITVTKHNPGVSYKLNFNKFIEDYKNIIKPMQTPDYFFKR